MTKPLTVGGLFSGIGGWELGLERAGMEIAWHCESDPFCQKVLAKHWPGVPCYEDVCGLTGATVRPVDVLCGGFPCQDISVSGRGAGIDGSRSGLWSEYARLVSELRPRYVIVENVPALLFRGLGRVLGDLAALGYDAEWDCIPASAFGAPHRRDRFWMVAYPHGGTVRNERRKAGTVDDGAKGIVAHATGVGHERSGPTWYGGTGLADGGGGSASDWWKVEPGMGRVAHGIPERMAQLHALGNALVPQIAEWIGRRIVAYEATASSGVG